MAVTDVEGVTDIVGATGVVGAMRIRGGTVRHNGLARFINTICIVIITVTQLNLENLSIKDHKFKDSNIGQPEGTVFINNPAHEQVK